MKIIVTGSESFIGKELIKQCKKEGISVIGIDIVNSMSGDYDIIKSIYVHQK